VSERSHVCLRMPEIAKKWRSGGEDECERWTEWCTAVHLLSNIFEYGCRVSGMTHIVSADQTLMGPEPEALRNQRPRAKTRGRNEGRSCQIR